MRPAQRRRTGKRTLPKAFTITELIVVMGYFAIVMGAATVLLFQMFDLQMRSEESSELTRSTNRLVGVFRDDIHRLGKPEIEPGHDGKETVLLLWQAGDTSVRYELHRGRFPGQQMIRRLEQSPEKDRSMEDYRLPDDTDIRFFEGKDKYAGLVALSLWKRVRGAEIPKDEEMNPFDRTLSGSPGPQEDPAHTGIWRTVLARYRP